MGRRIQIKDELDYKIERIQKQIYNSLGLKATKQQVINMMLDKVDINNIQPVRKNKSKEWRF